ncbi:hypothetical protein G3N55_06470 [Dissulfurirhabdus thermomarina]|uniref:MipA/OmpV family protein n=1 Tax=Dissulfurirhabdus thermomarina TaxID=1765737 RepID=A0A6N9TVH0_DISTH|nr:hypothetical protein [Dissulfurirhabdus thermomarina]NDY42486.1 hypothetical protein [Dissulfurirhabdus thermomarina]NMX22877.1 hypothetical protein [Dissulfurirhabdus thermomarina]
MTHAMNAVAAVLAATVLALGMTAALPAPAPAAEDRPTAGLTVDVLSQYVWRGFALTEDSVVVQPSLTVGYRGFEANLWGNVDTDRRGALAGQHLNSWTETDATLSYTASLGPVALTGGYIYYALDGVAVDDSEEVFAAVALDAPLNPTLTVYREVAHLPSWYVTLAVSHSVALPHGMSLDLGAQAAYLVSGDRDGYPEVDDRGVIHGKFNDFRDGLVSAALAIPVSPDLTVTPEVFWSFPLSADSEALTRDSGLSVTNDKDNFVYGGVSVSLAF